MSNIQNSLPVAFEKQVSKVCSFHKRTSEVLQYSSYLESFAGSSRLSGFIGGPGVLWTHRSLGPKQENLKVISIEIRSTVAALSCLKVQGRRPFVEETLTNFNSHFSQQEVLLKHNKSNSESKRSLRTAGQMLPVSVFQWNNLVYSTSSHLSTVCLFQR